MDSYGSGGNHRQINFVTYLEYGHTQGAWKGPESYSNLKKNSIEKISYQRIDFFLLSQIQLLSEIEMKKGKFWHGYKGLSY